MFYNRCVRLSGFFLSPTLISKTTNATVVKLRNVKKILRIKFRNKSQIKFELEVSLYI